MNTESPFTLHELPLTDLNSRAARAHDALRNARLRVGCVGGLEAIDDALDEVARLLPGLAEPPRTLLVRTMRDLAPQERKMLRDAIRVERNARERLLRILGGVAPSEAEEALARVEAQESIASEVVALLQLFEQTYRPLPGIV